MGYQPGDILGEKYRLQRLLGQGGMGSVFEAEHVHLRKRVALKVLQSEASGNEKVLKRFQLEAEAAASLGHPNIIDVYDIGADSAGAPFMVMELLEGQSLAEHLCASKRLNEQQTATIACQVLSALAAAHQRGIVHRDVKPENIFLVDRGRELPEVKLLDFGISKFTDPSQREAGLTTTGAVLGTPFYMSPEQATGCGQIDGRSDIYSLGVILYECVTGRPPIKGSSFNQVLVSILSGEIRPPSELCLELSSRFEAIVLKALSRDREERFRRAEEMLDELIPFVDEDTSSALITVATRAKDERSEGEVRSVSDDFLRSTVIDDDSVPVPDSADSVAEPSREPEISAEVDDEARDGVRETTGEERSAERSSGKRQLMGYLVVGVLLGGGLLLAAWLVQSRGTEGSEAVVRSTDGAQRRSVASLSSGSGDAEIESSDGDLPEGGTEEELGETVLLQISAQPRSATIELDGDLLTENPFRGRFPQDEVAHRLRVRAEGFREESRFLIFDRDREVLIELRARALRRGEKNQRLAPQPRVQENKADEEDDDPWRGVTESRDESPPEERVGDL